MLPSSEKQYLEYQWREKKSVNSHQEEQIINQLSDQLRNVLMIEANKMILKESPIFSNNFSDNVIQRTVPLIKEQNYSPNQDIFLQHEYSDQHIYFIEKGSIEIYTNFFVPGRVC